MKPRFVFRRLLLPSAFLVAVSSVSAAEYTWDAGGGGTRTWQTAANWNGDILPTFDDQANIFFYSGINSATSVIGDDRTIGSLTFNSDATTAMTLFLSDTNLEANGKILTLGSALVSPTITVDAASANHTIGATKGSISLANNLTANIGLGRTLTIARPINGTGFGLTKSGAGTLLLNSSEVNGFTGGLNIRGGTLALDYANLGATNNLIHSGNALTLGGGGTLRVTGNATNNSSQAFASSTFTTGGNNTINLAKGASATSATLNLGTLTVNPGSITTIITGAAGGTTWATGVTPTADIIRVTGITGKALPGASGTANWINVNAGLFYRQSTANGAARWVSVDNAGNLGGLPAGLTAIAAGTNDARLAFQLANNANIALAASTNPSIYGLVPNAAANPSTLTTPNSGTLTLNGIIQVNSGLTTINAGTGASNLVIGSERNLVINMDHSGGLTINAPIANNGAGASDVTIASTMPTGTPGSVTFGGTNTYTGATYVTGGTLVMNTTNRIANSSKISIGGGAKVDFSIAASAGFTLADGQDVEGTGSGTGNFNTGSVSTNGLITTGNSIFSHTGDGTLAFQRLDIRGTGNEMTGGNLQSGVAGTRRALVVGNTTAGEFTISGGTFTSIGGTSQPDAIGVNNASGTFNISGGNYANTGTLSFGAGNGTHPGGTLNVNSGSANIGTLLYNSNATGGQGIVNLNGGTLTVGTLTSTSGETREFNFNGGQFVASGNVTFNNSLTLNVKDGGAKIDTGANNVAVTGNLVNFGGTSTGGLTKTGSGTLTLSGANNYSGATILSTGTLAVNGTLGSGGVSVASGSTLSGTGSIGGTVTVANGSAAVTGGNGTSGTLTLQDLTFSGTGTVNVGALGNYTAAPAVDTTGVLTLSGGAGAVTINMPTASVASGTYQLLHFGSGISDASGFTLGSAPALVGRQSGSLVFDGANNLVNYAITAPSVIWTGAQSSEWSTNVISSPKNWTLSGGGGITDFMTNDEVVFDDSAANKTVDISNGDVSPLTVTFDNSLGNDYTLQGTNGIATGSLTKNGTGKVIIGTANTYSGLTSINAGTLQIGNGATSGTFGTGVVNVDGSSTLLLDRTDGGSMSADINFGAGAGGDNTMRAVAGVWDINGGTTNIDLRNTTTWAADAGATLNINVNGAGNNIGFSGDPVSLILDGAGTGVMNRLIASGNATGAVIKNGTGTWTFNAAYNGSNGWSTGGLTINGGVLAAGADNVIPWGIGKGDVTVNSPGVLDLTGGSLNVNGLAGGGTVRITGATDRSLTLGNADATAEFSGTIQNSGAGILSLTKVGTGVQTLSGTGSNFSGLTTISAGTLRLGANDGISTASGIDIGAGAPATATLDLNGFDQTLTSMVFTSQNVGGNLTITGGANSKLTVNTTSNTELGAGGTNIGASRDVTVDMSGLGEFAWNGSANTFRVGLRFGTSNASGTNPGTMTTVLADSNTITAASLAIGTVGASNNGGNSVLQLGTTNFLNADTINIGTGSRTNATMEFRTGLTAPKVTIRGTDGSLPVTNWNVGQVAHTANVTWTALADFSAGELDASVTNLRIGIANTGTSTGRAGTENATFTMGKGSLDATNLIIGQYNSGDGGTVTNTFRGNGTFNLNDAAGVVSADNIILADNIGTAGGGGTRTTSGTFNLIAGTLEAQSIGKGADTGNASSTTRIFNFSSGTVRNQVGFDLSIADVPITLTGSGTRVFEATASQTISVAATSAIGEDAAGKGLTKTGAGTLILAGTNSYTGTTAVSAGTLYVSGALSGSAVTVDPLGAIGSNGAAGTLGNGLTISAGGNIDLVNAALATNSTGILSLTGGSLTLGNLAFTDLVGWNWADAEAGTYELIDGNGSSALDFGSTAFLDENTAYSFGNGKSGYFTSDPTTFSLNAVIIIPEPSSALLGALGALLLLRRRR